MAPQPKKRHAKSRSRTRKASRKIKLPMLATCPNCHSLKLSHHLCPSCKT